jgi:DNA-binding IclR family transcriptional regulator
MTGDSQDGIRAALTSGRAGEAAERRGPERTVMGRVAAIMDAFNCSQQVLSLGDLSDRTGLPKSTLHRLADQLCQIGWIERDPGGYRVGLRMFELGSLAAEGGQLREVAFPHLQALAVRTGMTAQLGVLDHGEVVYLERIAEGSLRLPTRRGGRNPVYCTAIGKAMAAFDDEVIQAVTSGDMPRRTVNTITDPLALKAELNQVRRLGVAFDRGEAYDRLVCVAAPVRNAGGAVAAVSVTGPAGQMRWGMVAEAVRGTANAIWNASVKLGNTSARV